MENYLFQKKFEEKNARLNQALSYLRMVKEKNELGDNEGEILERTYERLEGAILGFFGWDIEFWSLVSL